MYKYKRVQFGWFLSYLLILTLPIVIGTLIYRTALQNNYIQAQKHNQSMMSLVMNEMDNQIARLQNEISRLSFDQTVHLLSNVKGSFLGENQMHLYTLYRDLRNIGFLEKYDEDVFIYFKNSDYIVSAKGNMPFSIYYNLYFQDNVILEDEFRDFLLEPHFQDIIPIQTHSRGTDLLFVSSSLETNVDHGNVTIGIRMKHDKLRQLLDSIKWEDQICFYVLNKNRQVVRDTDMEELNEFLKTDMSGEYNTITVDQISYYVSKISSSRTGWEYAMFLPEKLLKESARNIQRYAVFGLFFCILASFLLSFYLTKKNYHPLKSLLSIFDSQDTIKDENEYQWLAKKVTQMIQEHASVEEKINQNSKILKNYALFRLLEYSYDTEDTSQEYSNCYKDIKGSSAVVIFSFAEKREKPHEQYIQKNSLNKFIITNIFTEIAKEQFCLEITEIGDKVAAIVCLKEEELAVLKDMIENVQQMIQKWFSLSVLAAVSSVHQSPERIHESYQEAREAEEYIPLLESEIIFYQDIRNTNHKYFYPIEREEKIISAIKNGDAKTACEYINRVLEINYQSSRTSPNLWKCLLIDMLGTVLKGSEEIICHPEDFDFARELSAKLSLEDAQRIFEKNIITICENSKKQEDGRDNKLSEWIKQYINENYWNPDLNISQTANYFNRTPSYLSSIFKEQTNESLLQYINMVRITKAEQLLKQGSSVTETAEKVGFRESGTFIRVFKKYMGVTPGQLKKTSIFDNIQN